MARPGAKPKIYRAAPARRYGETNRLTIRFGTYEPFPLLRHFVCIVLRAACSSGPDWIKVAAPDGTLCVGIRAADSLTYTVTRHGTPVLLPSAIGLHFADGTVLGRGAKVTDARRETVERVVEAPFYRQARFTEHYNQLRLTFEGGYAVTFRVFDQGCAYRIETHLPGERTVAGEVASSLRGLPRLFAAYSDGLCNAYQVSGGEGAA